MFRGCSNLITLPELPATSFKRDCYSYMFCDCSKIGISSSLSAEYSADYRVPSKLIAIEDSNKSDYMFLRTKGPLWGTLAVNTPYYTLNKINSRKPVAIKNPVEVTHYTPYKATINNIEQIIDIQTKEQLPKMIEPVNSSITYSLETINTSCETSYGFIYENGLLTPENKGINNSFAYTKLVFKVEQEGHLLLTVDQNSEYY